LFAGSYKVTESGTSGYSASYSSGCSGTATGEFDSNPNIGYTATTSPTTGSQPITLPNLFVSTDAINQKITNETQDYNECIRI